MPVLLSAVNKSHPEIKFSVLVSIIQQLDQAQLPLHRKPCVCVCIKTEYSLSFLFNPSFCKTFTVFLFLIFPFIRYCHCKNSSHKRAKTSVCNIVSDLKAARAPYLYLMNSSSLGSFKSQVQASRVCLSFRCCTGKVLSALRTCMRLAC